MNSSRIQIVHLKKSTNNFCRGKNSFKNENISYIMALTRIIMNVVQWKSLLFKAFRLKFPSLSNILYLKKWITFSTLPSLFTFYNFIFLCRVQCLWTIRKLYAKFIGSLHFLQKVGRLMVKWNKSISVVIWSTCESLVCLQKFKLEKYHVWNVQGNEL